VLDGGLGDLVKLHAVHRFVVERAAFFQYFIQVPGDRLALAIRVGGEIQRVCQFHGLDDGVHVLGVLFDQIVLHGEAVGGIDRALFRDQVTHVAVGRERDEVLAQVFGHGLGLGR
jgi:hypothetical protein